MPLAFKQLYIAPFPVFRRFYHPWRIVYDRASAFVTLANLPDLVPDDIFTRLRIRENLQPALYTEYAVDMA